MDHNLMDEIKKEGHEIARDIKKKKMNSWMVVSGILVVALLVLIFLNNPITGSAVSETKAGELMVEFLNAKVGGGVDLVKVETEGDFYAVTVSYQGQEIPVYMTKDGKNFVQGIEKMEEVEATTVTNNTDAPTPTPTPAPTPEPTEVPKTDKPMVDLFIMSHCPYGTQAMKGMIPAAKALGDSIDFNLRFVYYAMHPTSGEVEEQLNMYCIQEEQEEKLFDYLECFLEAGKGEECLASTGIDTTKLKACTDAADEEFEITENLENKDLWMNGRFPQFNIDKEDNTKYGVRGSPTLVVNGVVSKSSRDSASYLTAICAAFNNEPEACSNELSSAAPSPGFGYGTTGSNTAASCG